MAKKKQSTKNVITTEQKPTVLETKLPEMGAVEKTKLEQSVEESEENVAKGFEKQESEPEQKDVYSNVIVAKEPKKGAWADADIKDHHIPNHHSIEDKVENYTEVQKQADIK